MSRYHPPVSVKTPRVPLKLHEAVQALAEVRTIDDAKYFADKADALAAWAKIYKDDEAGIEARRVKLHAYRRMGQLAEELRPTGNPTEFGRGRPMGAHSLLIEYGFARTAASRIMQIARTPKKKFESAVANAAGVHAAARLGRGMGMSSRGLKSDAWTALADQSRIRGLLARDAKELARGISKGEVRAARRLVTEVMEWFDEFEQYLPPE